MKITDKLVLHIKQFGVLKTFLDVIYKIVYVLFGWRTKVLFQLKYEINYQKHCNAVLNSGVVAKELSYEDFLKGDPHCFNQVKLDIVKGRFAIKDVFYPIGIVKENKLVYSMWIMLPHKCTYQDTYGIPLAEDEALLLDDYCHTSFRGLGFHRTMADFRLKKIYELGKKRAVVYVLSRNKPAMKVQFHSGFRMTACIKVIEFMNKRKVKIQKIN